MVVPADAICKHKPNGLPSPFPEMGEPIPTLPALPCASLHFGKNLHLGSASPFVSAGLSVGENCAC